VIDILLFPLGVEIYRASKQVSIRRLSENLFFLRVFVIPAKAGIQEIGASLDSRLRGNDVREAFSDSLLGACPRMALMDLPAL
jgi:hypothetical protein